MGGGHGGNSTALARRYPKLQATFELPAVAVVAREIIAAEGMRERVTVQEGDFQQRELGSGYGLVLFFGVLVSETPDGKVLLLRKAQAALVPGGNVVIRGFWLNDEQNGPVRETLFSLHMLLSTDAGDVSTLQVMNGWVSAAGFENPRLLPLQGCDLAKGTLIFGMLAGRLIILPLLIFFNLNAWRPKHEVRMPHRDHLT